MFTSLGVLVQLGLSGVGEFLQFLKNIRVTNIYLGQTASEWWAWELVALAASLCVHAFLILDSDLMFWCNRLGPVALATQSVLLVSCSTTFQAPFALSVATAVRYAILCGKSLYTHASIFPVLEISSEREKVNARV